MPGFEWLGKEESDAVAEVMQRGVLFRYEFDEQRQGIYLVKQFEQAMAEFTGAAAACAVSSGTAAVKVGLAALGVGYGDEVITQGFTFVATWEAILDCGAKPVFCEIDETLCMDPADLEKKITDKTKAIVPVHMMGAQARIKQIKAIADAKGIAVMEDTAQALGGTLEGRHLGTFGHMGSLSFDAVKTLTTGEGGMVISNDPALVLNASEYQDHGHDHKPVGRGNEGRRFMGFNYRMMELQGALGLVQLKKLPDMLATMRKNKAALKEALKRVPGVSFREVLDEAGDSATFLAWFHETPEQAQRFAGLLADNGAAAIPWGANTWHAYSHWEHLHDGASLPSGGWPFARPDGPAEYDPAVLPKTAEILSRCLSWQIMLNWDEAKLKQMTEAINRAVAEL
ncbi:MAG: DegT/DnrJ/EryC1/StrS family aminotransferase [Desulfarculaceae bacterium]|nr:DegT/DnrJ/EryC1/StrS family aminotransferase [Desulfarculaceae bacterium]MCF8073321.1 DegT/DnrJ/EryC1/StrS family aminotransferase [Desulfarculaceae bacterium]MCF8103243.1 DegT/DnrJ/EryC1/StrS family aminotransferase [Desulfarculaceae bacterium]MCF8116627.1 DegT/DnrJ/EryC1/StrS family aminotransferase [Desulfarculaceae bacterium]